MSLTLGLQRSAQASPEAIATRCGDRTRTFAQLQQRVSQLAGALRALGLEQGDRAAVLGMNSDHYAEALLSIAWCGAVFVPLNTRWSETELADSLNSASSSVLIVDNSFLPLVDRLRAHCPAIRAVLLMDEGPVPAGVLSVDALIADAPASEDARCAGSTLAGIFFTGGTTGHSKGAMLSHDNLLVSALGTLASGEFLTPGGTVLHVAPLFHLAGIWPWMAQMLIGGPHIFMPVFDPRTLVETIQERSVSDVLLVPTMIQMLTAHLAATGATLPTLRRIIYAGAPLPEALLQKTEHSLPHVALMQGYGMTELAPVATLLLPHEHVGAHRRSAGRPAPHSEVRIVDPEDQELPRGQVGEIVVRGGQVMLGYWKQPELSASTLRGGWMHTGDAGYMDDQGFVFVVDRIKDMIISGGENVYSAEVENVITQHPAVAACAVIGLADPQWGERVHAVVVLNAGQALSIETLRDFVGERIARYKAPRSLSVVQGLPVSAAGKVLKRELRLQHAPA